MEQGTGRGALSVLRRTVPLELCELTRGQRTETRMRSRMIIIKPPGFDDLPRFGQTVEQVFVQALVAETAVEALDESVLAWLCPVRCNAKPPDQGPNAG